MIPSILAYMIGISCLIIGVGVGVWLTRSGLPIGGGNKAREAQTELSTYRARVDEHFETTAQQFEALGRQYRDMYESMAASAQSLLDEDGDDRDNPFLRLALLPTDASPAPESDIVEDDVAPEAVVEVEAEPETEPTTAETTDEAVVLTVEDGNAANEAQTDEEDTPEKQAANA